MDGKKGGAVKVIPIDGCYLHVRYERLLGDKRKTANAFRTGWVTNTSTIHPATCRDVGGTTHAKSFYKYWNSRDFWVLASFRPRPQRRLPNFRRPRLTAAKNSPRAARDSTGVKATAAGVSQAWAATFVTPTAMLRTRAGNEWFCPPSSDSVVSG